MGDRQADYSEALLKYVGDPGQASLLDAQQFGEKALEDGLGLAEMAEIHHEALAVLLMRGAGEGSPGLTAAEFAAGMKAAGAFFAASILPHAVRLSECRESVAGLRHMNRRLEDSVVRAAHALYDEPLQLVAAAYLVLNQFAAESPPGKEKHLALAAAILNQLEEQLTGLSQELHPCVLDHLGPDAAATWLAGYFKKMAGAEVVVEASPKLALTAPMARVMYRAILEALANIAKFAQARNVNLRLGQEGDSIACAIRDDGAGFDVSGGLMACGERGLWLIGIRESVRTHGGNLTVSSNLEDGTELVIAMPLSEGRDSGMARQSGN